MPISPFKIIQVVLFNSQLSKISIPMAEKINYKIVLLGDAAVGKSSIMTRYIDNYYRPDTCSTIALDLRTKQLQIQNKVVKLQLWDTAGQQLFRAISPAYYKNANAIIVVFDLMNKKSLQNIQSYWTEQIKKHCVVQPEVIILGNKQDQQVIKVDTECLAKLQQKYKIRCFQVSAKTGEGITEAFQFIVNKCFEKTKAKMAAKKSLGAAAVKKPSGFGGKINRKKRIKQRCY